MGAGSVPGSLFFRFSCISRGIVLKYSYLAGSGGVLSDMKLPYIGEYL